MFTQLFRNWWLFAVRGVIAIVFGLLALIWPRSAMLALVLLFGAYALLDGIFAVAVGIASHGYFERWWAVLLEGLAGIVIGITTFFWPNITALIVLYFVAAWAVITGIFEIVAAIKFRHVIPGKWAMILNGLLSFLLGALLFVFPAAGEVGLMWLIGIYAVVAGVMGMLFAFGLQRFYAQAREASVASA